MSPKSAMIAGAEADGVHIVHRRDRFPIPGTKAEKRAERGVVAVFVLAALAGVAFIVVVRAPCRTSGTCRARRRTSASTRRCSVACSA